MVTGMGFCLPGDEGPLFTVGEVWDVAANGRSCLKHHGVYYGSVDLPDAAFAERLPDLPGIFSKHYTNAHRYGLVSLVEACADAQLSIRGGDLSDAAVLVGRGGIDANVASYLEVLHADARTTAPHEAMELFVRAQQGLTPSDVALVQGALMRTTGPCFTVSCGCASSAVQIGNARRMIADGDIDLAVVTGVDVFGVDVIQNVQRLLHGAQRAYDSIRVDGMPELLPAFDRVMRPYDRRADCVNHGEGSVTLVLESRSRAEQRGAYTYGQVLSHGMTRDGLSNPLASDENGASLVAAVRKCLGDRWDVGQIPYIHGGSDGDVVVTAFEANAAKQLYGDGVADLLMTSQEACFGHNGAPAGALGVALTLLMLEQGEVCPTANCEEPADNVCFDPVPGVHTRLIEFDYALTLNYQIGGVKSAILLGSSDAG
ncbi:3-oxoacyl-[acyl-carrier-protein] synthase 2 OS=Kitasatospora aureofaciens OX=1894 GN=GCM10010502_73750 PE=3 SV=1 [Kitasatospora aureofaciens]|uniref:3-oxoacyl-[acyl-carrier-protein] synthase 2 n=2 Tax=Kitasatospora aureofaciens TaxID=1894 RepID=A0A8H9I2J6_KITAU|nr:ketoacyl synthase [Kitasatospora aureofaciens]QEV03463.1 ketoacyl synthase [Streptomyces viridifaciens]GGV07944.1 3-oxoacyl-[acyl-carrier-protein] synthase 2 [Kitasatospora aureofaciens]